MSDGTTGKDGPAIEPRYSTDEQEQLPGRSLPLPSPRPDQRPALARDSLGGETIPQATSPRAVSEGARLTSPTLYFNRELSWLDFNWRVVHQALDERHPLLERVRFLSIAAGNLDEFFMKRVGGLKRQLAAGVLHRSLDGRTPGSQLKLIRSAVVDMQQAMSRVWSRELQPSLQHTLGIEIVDYEELNEAQRTRLHAYFRSHIYPILTPLAVDPGHPFPFISSLSLSLAVTLRHPQRDTRHFARVKIPRNRSRWIELDQPGTFLPVEELVLRHVDELFRGMEVESVHVFRVTRNADVRRAEEEADDLLKVISAELRERRFAPVVRIEVEASMPRDQRELLIRELGLTSADLYEVRRLLDLAELSALTDLAIPEHRFEPWEPVIPAELRHEGESEPFPDVFKVLRATDVMVHHPYDSFAASVQRFIEEAAVDPSVLAIKQTLYRTSDDSPIVRALIRAAEMGKQVAVLVEVSARFDELENIEWGQMLEDAGVHVTYGLVGLKTHAKVTLVARDEKQGIVVYCHIGTGNYHTGTARQYTDIGILSANPDLANDVVNLFHYLTGYAPEQTYKHLLVAPRDMRKAFLRMIKREIKHAKRGEPARIVAKMNALDDAQIIRTLYKASRAGVKVDLIVRGVCRLRPGVSGVSDNIRVCSIIGRFLEHDRIYRFHNGGDPKIYIGSADWRRRNLDDRVEALAPVYDERLRDRLSRVLDAALEDNRRAWDLSADGRYVLRHPGELDEVRDYHAAMMKDAIQRRRAAEAPWDIRPPKRKKKSKPGGTRREGAPPTS